ncbi:acyloxyacyl hydrolase [Desulfopila sp. IMCC35008]|uniref:acyloxyacyl hydrolase n=1 Tax=Desulfopila sp. IMCC35008 TaxID=2653858 RepID=UPI0013D4FA99|nr:acyloxyacyl hydrolase [Desulfopila sp. IMCC35008]
MICNRLISVGVAICLMLVTSEFCFADLRDIGIRYGNTFTGADLDQYDAYVSFDLPWSYDFASGWKLESGCEVSLSALDGEGENAFKPSVLGYAESTSPDKKFHLLAGFGAGLMSEYIFGEYDLGGTFFFLGTLGFRINLTEHILLGFRYLHQSNAELYDSNDSLNMNQIELIWKF